MSTLYKRCFGRLRLLRSSDVEENNGQRASRRSCLFFFFFFVMRPLSLPGATFPGS